LREPVDAGIKSRSSSVSPNPKPSVGVIAEKAGEGRSEDTFNRERGSSAAASSEKDSRRFSIVGTAKRLTVFATLFVSPEAATIPGTDVPGAPTAILGFATPLDDRSDGDTGLWL
jgi:hypothetical protein